MKSLLCGGSSKRRGSEAITSYSGVGGEGGHRGASWLSNGEGAQGEGESGARQGAWGSL